MILRSFFCVVLSSVSLPVMAAELGENRPETDLIAANCGACHGTFGRVFNDSMPPLAGMAPEKFVAAMIAFRDGQRPATIMDRLAPGFTEAEYQALADYYAAQEASNYVELSDDTKEAQQ